MIRIVFLASLVVFAAFCERPAAAQETTAGDLKRQYEAKEQEAAETARQLRNAPRPADNLKTRLRQTVAEAFALRQRLHEAELAEFQERMAKVQQTIRTREQIKDAIIDRRVEDLLNPDLNWERPAETDSTDRTVGPSQDATAKTTAVEPTATAGGANSAQPVATSSVPQKRRQFESSNVVGVVTIILADGRIEISCKEPGGIRVGEELQLSRPDSRFVDRNHDVGWIVIVELKDQETAIGRATEMLRALRENKYVRETVQPGDSVLRPNYWSDADVLREAIRGTWKIDFADYGGVKTPGVGLQDAILSFWAERIPAPPVFANRGRDDLGRGAVPTYSAGNFEGWETGKSIQSGIYRVDTTKSPAQINLAGWYKGDPLIQFGICKLEGDILLLCLAQTEGERPDTFTAQNGRVFLKLTRIENPPVTPMGGMPSGARGATAQLPRVDNLPIAPNAAAKPIGEPKKESSPSEAKPASFPRIVRSIPAAGATAVDLGIGEISVTFDQDMSQGMSWTGGPPHFPPTDKSRKARWIDARTCILPVTLEKGSYYRVGINSSGYRNFSSADNVPAPPSVICFSTAGATAEVAARVSAPVVVAIDPKNGADDVDPQVDELRVTFNVPMEGGMSWTGGGQKYPKSRPQAKARWSADGLTCTLPVALEAGHDYEIGLNSVSHINFQSKWGVPLEPVAYKFRTRGE